MQQIFRNSIFETNSSSIHCLTLPDNKVGWEVADTLRKLLDGDILPYYDRAEIDNYNEFDTPQKRLRYLWTIASYYREHGWDREKEQEFINILRTSFPNIHFKDADSIYLEDYEWGIDDYILFDATFIIYFVLYGKGYFLTRDNPYYPDTESYFEFEHKLENIRKLEKELQPENIKYWEG